MNSITRDVIEEHMNGNKWMLKIDRLRTNFQEYVLNKK